MGSQTAKIELLSRLRGCNECTLGPRCEGSRAQQVALPRGPESAQVMVIGEAPGRMEDKQGLTLVGPSGKRINELLHMAGLDPDRVWFTNIAKCWPPATKSGKQGKPTPTQQNICSDLWLREEIELVDPDLIITLGNIPLQHFMDHVKIGDSHGQVHEIDNRRVMTMYHPAAGMHNPRLAHVIDNDFQQLSGKLRSTKRKFTYDYVQTRVQFETWLQNLRDTTGPIAIDFETTDLRPRFAELVGIAAATGPEHGTYISFGTDRQARSDLGECLEQLLEVVANRQLIAHNANYELSVIGALRERASVLPVEAIHGNYRTNYPPLNFDCTMIMARLLGREVINLKSLALSELGVQMTHIEEVWGDSKNMADVDPADVASYAASDAVNTWRLYHHFDKIMDDPSRRVYNEIEKPLLPVVVTMQLEGFQIDKDAVETARFAITTKRDGLLEDIHCRFQESVKSGNIRLELEPMPTKRNPERTRLVYYGPTGERIGPPVSTSHPQSANWQYNPSSSSQAPAFLGLRDAKAGTYEEDGGELPLMHRDYDHLSKLLSSYIIPVRRMADDGGRAYFSFNQAGTDTGRFSASGWRIVNDEGKEQPWGINAQTMPKPKANEDRSDPNTESKLVRRQFVADDVNSGCCGIADSHPHSIVELDYSQIELRVLAHWSKDQNMVDAYLNERDLHDEMMRNSGLTDRRIAKILNFGCSYEPNDWVAAGVVKRAAIKDNIRLGEDEARQAVDFYRTAWPEVPRYYDFIHDYSRQRGYVETLEGRRTPARYVPDPFIRKPKYRSPQWGAWKDIQKANEAELRRLINMPVQGSAADVLKKAMIALYPTTPTWVKWKGTVHDSLLFQCPTSMVNDLVQWAKPMMENTSELLVPILVDATSGPNWADQEDVA